LCSLYIDGDAIHASFFLKDDTHNLHNAIESVYVTDPGGTNPATEFCPNSKIVGFCSEMANIGKEVHQGVEFEVCSTPLWRLTLNASYSFLNRDITYAFEACPM